MGAAPSVPEPHEANELVRSFRRKCKEAATVIQNADVLLLCTGAGFSADSGLAVYRDVANIDPYKKRDLEYHDICVPDFQETEPDLFWGFWGMCFNDYRQTEPHEGYAIVRKWRDRFFSNTDVSRRQQQLVRDPAVLYAPPSQPSFMSSKEADDREPYSVQGHAGAFFVFTSNVDAHSFDHFEANEVRECHGSTEVYQCANRCCDKLWRAPMGFSFAVDRETMLAPLNGCVDNTKGIVQLASKPPRKAAVGSVRGSKRRNPLNKLPMPRGEDIARCAQSFNTNHPTCIMCGGPARPAILMFGDENWIDSSAQSLRYDRWTGALTKQSHERALPASVTEESPGTSDTPPLSTRATKPTTGPMPPTTTNTTTVENVTKSEVNLPVDDKIAEPAKAGGKTDSYPGRNRKSSNPPAVRSSAAPTTSPPGDHGTGRAGPLRLVILEIGCGGNVTTVRATAEDFAIQIAQAGGKATLVRVNPELPCADRRNRLAQEGVSFLPIMGKGLDALKCMDSMLQRSASSTAADPRNSIIAKRSNRRVSKHISNW